MQGRDKKYSFPPANSAAIENELRRYRIVQSVEFARIYENLTEGLDLEVFEEEWMSEGIRTFVKEAAIRVHEGETEFPAAQEEVRAYYDRKRRFYEV